MPLNFKFPRYYDDSIKHEEINNKKQSKIERSINNENLNNINKNHVEPELYSNSILTHSEDSQIVKNIQKYKFLSQIYFNNINLLLPLNSNIQSTQSISFRILVFSPNFFN